MHMTDHSTWDELDSRILKLLRLNGRMPLAQIARQLGVAMSTVSNRIKRLTEAGVVQGYRLVVDPRLSIAGVEALVTLTTPRHEDLQRVLTELAEAGVQVAEVYRTLGSAEYVCRVVAPSADHLDRAMTIARRAEKDRVDAVVLSELLPTSVTSSALGSAATLDRHLATADSASVTKRGDKSSSAEWASSPPVRRLPAGSRIYFISLTELDPEELAPAQWVEQLARAGFSTVVVDAINPWGAYYPTRLAPLAPHCHGQDLIEAFCVAAEQHGLQVLAAIECRAVPPFLAAEHPRWLQRHASGEAIPAYGPFYRGCYRTGWQEWLRSIAKQLLEGYPLAGLVLLNPEYDSDSCYCETCQQGFRNRRGVQPPAHDGSVDYPTYARWLDWKVESVVGLVAGLTRLVHQSSAQRQLWVMSDQTLAERPQAFGLDLSQLAAVANAVICAGEPQQRSSAPLLDALDRWDRGAALTPPGAFAASLSASYAPWTRYPVPANCLQQAVGALHAAGQEVTCLDLGSLPPALLEDRSQRLPRLADAALPASSRVDAPPTHPNRPRSSALPPTVWPPSIWPRRSGSTTHDLGQYAALLSSERDWCSEHGQQAAPTHAACFHGLYSALSHANIPFRVISLEQVVRSGRQQAELETCRTLILPGLNDLPLAFAKWLADFVQNGHGLLVTYPGLLADRQSQGAPVLQELLGLARVSGPPQQAEAAYVKRLTAASYSGPELLPAFPRWLTCEPDRAVVWAELLSQESAWGGVAQTGCPALLAHTKGQGRTVCCSFPLGVLYSQFPNADLEQLLRSTVEWTARQPTPVQIDAERPLWCRILRPTPRGAAQATTKANAATDPDTHADAQPDTHADAHAPSGPNTDPNAHSGTDNRSQTDTDSGSQMDPQSGSRTHTDTGSQTDTDASSQANPAADGDSIGIYLVDGDFAWGPRPWRQVSPLPHGSLIVRLPRPPQAAYWSATSPLGGPIAGDNCVEDSVGGDGRERDGFGSIPAQSTVPAPWQRLGSDRYRFPLPACTGAATLRLRLTP